ncbi:hypothetical protein VCR17J2_150028 [Vibrio coralliirubri]|nr:hypothetical protein VCR17J2_150028 [Vibrio coralliirubri]
MGITETVVVFHRQAAPLAPLVVFSFAIQWTDTDQGIAEAAFRYWYRATVHSHE